MQLLEWLEQISRVRRWNRADENYWQITWTWSVFVLAAIHASTKVSIALWKSIPFWDLNVSPGPRKSPPFVIYRVVFESSQNMNTVHSEVPDTYQSKLKRDGDDKLTTLSIYKQVKCQFFYRSILLVPPDLQVTWSTRTIRQISIDNLANTTHKFFIHDCSNHRRFAKRAWNVRSFAKFKRVLLTWVTEFFLIPIN